MAIYYLGAFPVEGGGVTNKNRDIYSALSKEHINIKKIDVNRIKRKKGIKEVIRFLMSLLPGNRFIIGLSGVRGNSVRMVKFLNMVTHSNLKKSIYFMMGGTEASKIAQDSALIKLFGNLKQIYVETPSMKDIMNSAGMNNISLYPNCRPRSSSISCYNTTRDTKTINCVFFSYIDEMKGVDIILDAAKRTSETHYSFYGDISEEYKDKFLKAIASLKNCSYNGYFNGKPSEIYTLLQKFDLLLFPTKWECEGVPGILVEAKIAGVPVIASKNSFNGEIVEDGVDGILLKENNSVSLCNTLNCLRCNKDTIIKMKKACQITSKKYYIDQYIKGIVEMLMMN